MLRYYDVYLLHGGDKGGDSLINSLIRQLCILSVFFAAVTLIIPEGSVKKLTTVLCTVILFTVILETLGSFSFDTYAETIAGYRDMSAALNTDSQAINRELNRLVIEESCQTYIKDKGAALGVELEEVKVQVQWSMDGVWYPVSAQLSSAYGRSDELLSVIEAELGIPKNAIEWNGG